MSNSFADINISESKSNAMDQGDGVKTCEEIKGWDMVDYLSTLGYKPERISGNDYWYLSPLRNERSASFKVFRKGNVWYDHGAGQGGNLVDFCLLYYQCNVRDLLTRIGTAYLLPTSIVQNRPSRKKDDPDQHIKIERVQYITSGYLKHYLQSRNISLEIAEQYCKEISFSMHRKVYRSIGFLNRSEGFELRNVWFKGSSSPKDITLFQGDSERLAVFEGFFDFLSYRTLFQKEQSPSDYLILNSLSFVQRAIPIINQYSATDLYLDQGRAGQQQTQLLLSQFPGCIDKSTLYKEFDDLNAWHCHAEKPLLRQKKVRWNR